MELDVVLEGSAEWGQYSKQLPWTFKKKNANLWDTNQTGTLKN